MKKNYLIFFSLLLCSIGLWGQYISAPSSTVCPGSSQTYSYNYNLTCDRITWKLDDVTQSETGIFATLTAPTTGTSFVVKVIGENLSTTLKDAEGNYIYVACESASLTVNIRQKPATPIISGNSYLACGLNNAMTYTATGGTDVDANGYSWSNTAWYPSAASNNYTITYIPSGNSSPTISVTTRSASCPALISSPGTLTVNRVPIKPTLVVNPANVTKNNQYTFQIASIAGASYYEWSVSGWPAGMTTIIGSPNNTTCTIYFGSNGKGTVSVKAKSNCGDSAPLDILLDVICPEPSSTSFDFCTPVPASTSFTYNSGWANDNILPRMMVDVNNDGRDDIVGFGPSNVNVALKSVAGNGFDAPTTWSSFFAQLAWPNMNTHPRMIVDVDNDGFPDIVGFGSDHVWVALNKGIAGPGFKLGQAWCLNSFGVNTGWSDNTTYPRMLADVNMDTYPDIVGFASFGVVVALNKANGTGFKVPALWSTEFGTNSGWSNNSNYPRFVKDMNNDNKADIIGFSSGGVMVSISNGVNSFISATRWSAAFEYGYPSYESQDKHPRAVIDMDNDGRPDIVGFKNGVNVSINSLAGTLMPQAKWMNDIFSYENSDWISFSTHPRLIGDVNGDGFPDVVGFNQDKIYTSLNVGGGSLDCPSVELGNTINAFTVNTGYTNQNSYPRFLSQLDGDNRKEIIGFGGSNVKVMNNCVGGFRTTDDQAAEDAAKAEIMTCYPNPFKGTLTVDCNTLNSNNASVALYNTLGIKVKETSFTQGEKQIIFSGENLETGTYFCILSADGQVLSRKTVILQK